MIPGSVLDTRGNQVTYTKKSAACIQPCCTSLSGLGNLKPPPTYSGPPLSPSTLIPSTLTSLHLDHLSLLTRRVWPTPTHSGYSLRKYNSCRKQVIILLLVVSPTPLIYIFWLFAGFAEQGVCWIYFLLKKKIKPFVGSKLFQVLSGFMTHWIPQYLGTCNILKYLACVTKETFQIHQSWLWKDAELSKGLVKHRTSHTFTK